MHLGTRQLALMSMLMALNIAVGAFVQALKLPIYLDAIGTIVCAVLLGLVPAVMVGVLSFSIAAALLSPVYIWFTGTQAVIAVFVYWCASRFHVFRSVGRTVLAGTCLGLVAGVVSAPVIVLVFGGVAGSGRDLITAGLLATGQQVYKAVLLSGAASEPIDKTLQLLAAFFIFKTLPRGILGQFRNPVLESNGIL
jgi:energy-coupling factor transport system substrate-specific component